MPIRLSDLEKDHRTCTFSVGEEKAQITYRPSAYTPELESSIMDEMDQTRLGKMLAELLSKILIEWEIVDDQGNMIPPTKENLMKFPVTVLSQIMDTVGSDLQSSGETKKNSGGGSLRKVK